MSCSPGKEKVEKHSRSEKSRCKGAGVGNGGFLEEVKEGPCGCLKESRGVRYPDKWWDRPRKVLKAPSWTLDF